MIGLQELARLAHQLRLGERQLDRYRALSVDDNPSIDLSLSPSIATDLHSAIEQIALRDAQTVGEKLSHDVAVDEERVPVVSAARFRYLLFLAVFLEGRRRLFFLAFGGFQHAFALLTFGFLFARKDMDFAALYRSIR